MCLSGRAPKNNCTEEATLIAILSVYRAPPTGNPIVRPVNVDHTPDEVPPGALGSSQNHQPLGVGPKVLLFRTMSAVYAVTGLRPNSVQTQKFIPATWPVRNSSLLTTSYATPADLASPRGFCAGVERAIQTIEESLTRFGAPVFVRHQIVHNA
jgi:LytB protein